MSMRNWLSWLILSIGIVLLDQVTKYFMADLIVPGESITVTPFFSLVLTYNTGAAFSLLSDAGGWQRSFFTGVAVVASGIIIYLLRKHYSNMLFSLSLSLILGGAIGNLIDRIRLGHVVDFLYFYYKNFHWPAFNVADTAITCGALLLILDSFRKRDVKQPDSSVSA